MVALDQLLVGEYHEYQRDKVGGNSPQNLEEEEAAAEQSPLGDVERMTVVAVAAAAAAGQEVAGGVKSNFDFAKRSEADLRA